jgi:dUTP pyrophosphatase
MSAIQRRSTISSEHANVHLPYFDLVRLSPHARAPERAYEASIGYDLFANIVTEQGNPTSSILPPRSSKKIGTGFIALAPPGYFITVCSRSGLALHSDPIFVANAPGIVDPDYTGELCIIVFNGGHTTYYVRHQESIAQAVLLPRPPSFQLREVESSRVPLTERGPRGFGSTHR